MEAWESTDAAVSHLKKGLQYFVTAIDHAAKAEDDAFAKAGSQLDKANANVQKAIDAYADGNIDSAAKSYAKALDEYDAALDLIGEQAGQRGSRVGLSAAGPRSTIVHMTIGRISGGLRQHKGHLQTPPTTQHRLPPSPPTRTLGLWSRPVNQRHGPEGSVRGMAARSRAHLRRVDRRRAVRSTGPSGRRLPRHAGEAIDQRRRAGRPRDGRLGRQAEMPEDPAGPVPMS